MSISPSMTSSNATVATLIFGVVPDCYDLATTATKFHAMRTAQGIPEKDDCYESATTLLREGRSVALLSLIERGATPAPSAQ